MDLAIAAPPPAAGFDEHDPAVCARWMARVAMHLDDALDARATVCAADNGGMRTPSCVPSEAGGRWVFYGWHGDHRKESTGLMAAALHKPFSNV